ncbi:MAG TPA: hypothetical protein VEQ15_00245 [Myxococcales bacterium]|nr:hypothetical protein [Myxococcales bacterium]
MSQMLRRPPAKEVHVEPQQGPLVGRQTYAAVDSAKSYGAPEAGRQAGSIDLRPEAREIEYVWQLFQQMNPAHEQPRLDFTSGRQPFTVGMQLRRFSRTRMTASPRFLGRWAYVGQIQRAYAERARITGVATRRGTTYAYPRFVTAPRTVTLGSG